MATIDLDAIQARADGAPQGMWFVHHDGSVWVDHYPEAESIRSASGLTAPLPVWADGAADFIANAPADVIALLAEVRRLRADVATGHAMVQAERALTLAVMDVTR